jgi:hypothetical protein
VPGNSTCTIPSLIHSNQGYDEKLAIAMRSFIACLLDFARHLGDLENQNRKQINKSAHG